MLRIQSSDEIFDSWQHNCVVERLQSDIVREIRWRLKHYDALVMAEVAGVPLHFLQNFIDGEPA